MEKPVVIVTGSGRNIGRAIALQLAREGMTVIVAGPDLAELETTAAEVRALGQTCLPLAVDVRIDGEVEMLARKTTLSFGRIDVLVNNAAIVGPTAPVEQIDRAEWDEVLSVNLTGAFLCSRAVLPAMKAQKSGKIINISSIAGKIAYPLRSPYAVSKWGLIGFTLTLAREVGEFNIQVNAVCPGPVAGERMKHIIRRRAAEMNQNEEEVERWYLDQMALKRMVEAEDVAHMVAYLASHKADNITGQTFDVTAGYGL